MAMQATEGPKRPLPDESVDDSSIVLKKQKTESALATSQQKPGVGQQRFCRRSFVAISLPGVATDTIAAYNFTGPQQDFGTVGTNYATHRTCW